MVVVTPTYAPDLELFRDLHQSVLQCFPGDVRHLAVVPETHRALFRQFEGPRCQVLGVREVLPRSVVALPFLRLNIGGGSPAPMWVNVRRPVPPLRGWIIQQLVKLAIANQLPEKIIVTADSDLVFVRPVTTETFTLNGLTRLYRLDEGVDDSLPRHVKWHGVARGLLGMPSAPPPPLPDYVTALVPWDRDVVKRMLRRVEEATGGRWLDAVGRELHFSECILYGVYADEFERAEHVSLTSDSLLYPYWETAPLTTERAATWLSDVGPTDVAYMISAKSHTSLDVRRAAHASIFPG
jgi:hypothetical protein